MKKLLLLMLTLVMSVTAWAVTVEKTMVAIATANGWETSSGTTIYNYYSFQLDENITVSVSEGGNNGSFWGEDWRIYQAQNAELSITAATGYTLQAVTFTYTISNSGTLMHGSTKLTSGTEEALTGSKETFTVGNTNSSKNNGQIRISAISITYKENSGTDPDPDPDPDPETPGELAGAKTVVFDLSTNGYEWDATTDGNIYFDGATYTPAVEDDITLSVAGRVRMWGSTASSLRLYAGDSETIADNGSITLDAALGYNIHSVTFEGSSLTLTPSVGTYEKPTWTGKATSVTFEKGSSTPQIKKITVTYAPYQLTIGATKWATLCLDYSYAAPEGVKFYSVATATAEGVELHEVTTGVKGSLAVLVYAAAGTYAVKATDDYDSNFPNLLQGVTVDTPCAANENYVLGDNGNGTVSFGLYHGTTLKANRAYLPASVVPEGARANLTIDIETGIEQIATDQQLLFGKVYDLQGRELQSLQKGFNIMNGKKVIVK